MLCFGSHLLRGQDPPCFAAELPGMELLLCNNQSRSLARQVLRLRARGNPSGKPEKGIADRREREYDVQVPLHGWFRRFLCLCARCGFVPPRVFLSS